MSDQLDLFERPKPRRRNRGKEAVLNALGHITGSADTLDIQRTLAAFDVTMDRNVIAKRLQDLEADGLVQRVGHNWSRRGNPTTWRRTERTGR